MDAHSRLFGASLIPEGITSPVSINDTTEQIELWTGNGALLQGADTYRGTVTFTLDTLPRPNVRFEFRSSAQPRGDFESIASALTGDGLGEGSLACDGFQKPIPVQVNCIADDAFFGSVDYCDEIAQDDCASAKFMIINGPDVGGKPIIRGRVSFVGQFEFANEEFSLTVDRLSPASSPKRRQFSFTHVAEIKFNRVPLRSGLVDELTTVLFNTLSFMRGGWVGIVGPWYFQNEVLRAPTFRVTKCTRRASGYTWCHSQMGEAFGELYRCLFAAQANDPLREVLQTSLHWFVESHMCAGGVEGSLILQQAALEALSWHEIVQKRRICSADGFEKLNASDKIRWLTSIFSIDIAIPAACLDLTNYSASNNLNGDIPGVMADVRNALIHGSPKKAEKLLHRKNVTVHPILGKSRAAARRGIW